MKCPKCGSDMLVADTRETENNRIRRRRVCNACRYRLTTYEITLEQLGEYNRIERENDRILNKVRELISIMEA
jgi:transcriptional regulator NrdR family protein